MLEVIMTECCSFQFLHSSHVSCSLAIFLIYTIQVTAYMFVYVTTRSLFACAAFGGRIRGCEWGHPIPRQGALQAPWNPLLHNKGSIEALPDFSSVIQSPTSDMCERNFICQTVSSTPQTLEGSRPAPFAGSHINSAAATSQQHPWRRSNDERKTKCSKTVSCIQQREGA